MRSHSNITSRTNHLLNQVLRPETNLIIAELEDSEWQGAINNPAKIAELREAVTVATSRFFNPKLSIKEREKRGDIPGIEVQLANWEELVKGFPLMELDIRSYPNPYNEPILLVPFMDDVCEAAWRAIVDYYTRERLPRPTWKTKLLYEWLGLGHKIGMAQYHWREKSYTPNWAALINAPAYSYHEARWKKLEEEPSRPDRFRFHAVPIVHRLLGDELLQSRLFRLTTMDESRTFAAVLGVTGLKWKGSFGATSCSHVVCDDRRYFSIVGHSRQGSSDIDIQDMTDGVGGLLLCRLPLS